MSGFRCLTALPVYNEAAHVSRVLDDVLRHADEVLVVDDGSTDGSAEILEARAAQGDIRLVRHAVNGGCGAALATAIRETLAGDWAGMVTIDADGQHQPQLIPTFAARLAAGDADIVSGSRYLGRFPGDSEPPADRRRINMEITAELNARLGLALTDAFCGFRAYSRHALERLTLTEPGYAWPLEVWAQAAAAGLSIVEMPVPLVYLDLARSFGGALDDAATRLAYYRRVLDRAEHRLHGCAAAVAAGDAGSAS